jgi:hypothetical protein
MWVCDKCGSTNDPQGHTCTLEDMMRLYASKHILATVRVGGLERELRAANNERETLSHQLTSVKFANKSVVVGAKVYTVDHTQRLIITDLAK